MNPQTIYHQIASARLAHSDAQSALKLERARAEQQIITSRGGDYGKNAEERERTLALALAAHNDYQRVVRAAREAETVLLMLEADLEVYKDARRQEEWSIRAELARAIGRRVPGADEGDMGVDEVADEEALVTVVDRERAYAEMAELY